MMRFVIRLMGWRLPRGIGSPGRDRSGWWLVAGCWLLVAGCWLLVAGCWLLVEFFRDSYFSSTNDLNSFIACPNSFFLSFGTFFISAKRLFTSPLVPSHFIRNSSTALASVAEKLSTSFL